MDEDGLNRFLAEAAAHRLLTAGEERALGRRVQAGIGPGAKLTPDALAARNELVTSNIRLVVSVARYYRNRGLPMSDVIQDGIKGLHRAAEKYDPEREIRFSTYATLWIKQAIQRGLASAGTAIRLPSTVAGIRVKVRAVKMKHPDADVQFIADLLDLDVEDIERAVDAAEVVTSLDREVTTDEHSHTLLDAMSDGDALDPFEEVMDDLSADLYLALDALERNFDDRYGNGKKHRRVIEMHFGLTGRPPLTMQEISDKLGGSDKGFSINTVKNLRAEAIEFLGHRMDHHA